MNKIRFYIPKVFFTFLLVFLLIGSELALLVQQKALAKKTFENVIVQQDLGQKAYSSLDAYFQSRSNSTGIPKEVFMNALDENTLADSIYFITLNGLDYLNGKTDTYSVTLDFTKLETSVTAFFNQYAEENGFQKEETFNQKVQSTIEEAEKKILLTTDTFKFSTLYENGWLAKLRKFLSLFRNIMTALFIATGIIIIVLVLFCKSQISELCYWLGLSSFLSGLLTAFPCLYVLETDYFSGFVIKDPQIFSAVVGYMQYFTSQVRNVSLGMCTAGILFLLLFAFIPKKS
ncbi:MAG: hypothetical protein IKI37_02450 [Oscillospiraceae bacterium]|nr:hypothetical protein [Oscillospiraceae bacterium]MBR7084026.1 hypothetical protein [Oscillospiraceae bacterium]